MSWHASVYTYQVPFALVHLWHSHSAWFPGVHVSSCFMSATTTHRDKAIDFNKRVCTLTLYPLGLALLTLSRYNNWDSHSPMNGYPSFYPRIALVTPSPGGWMCMYIKPWLSPGDAMILVPLVLFCDNWAISQISHCTFPYPTICNIQNKDAHIFVLNGVLCDMGHVHCGIYENSLFIIRSGLAWCHHAPDLYLASNGHGRMVGCPTNLNGIRKHWFF